MKLMLFCLLFFLFVPWANATNVRQKYVGRNGCAPEFKSQLNHSGIRLDKNQHARLEAHEFRTGTVLVIVQYNDDTDQCGTVRDAIESQPTDTSFVWDCVDKRNPSAVVVGTWPSGQQSTSGPAVEAWRIDLRQLKFDRLTGSVSCSAPSYAGIDEGDDLATWARKRAIKP
jgi:hypothetical protein